MEMEQKLNNEQVAYMEIEEKNNKERINNAQYKRKIEIEDTK